MPSKLNYELNKLRGTTAADGKIYTASIAALQDALIDAEIAIKCLESEKLDNIAKINSALSKSSQALSSANSSVKKTGDTLSGTLITSGIIPLRSDFYDCGSTTRYYRFIRGNYLYAYSCLYSDIISEKTTNAGVTIDTVLLKDGNVDGLDCSGVEAGATADQSDAEIKTAYENATPTVNTINEKTAGSGVTIDSLLLKDGRANQNIVSTGQSENITVTADGTITPTKSYIRLDTNGGAATDDLNHIHLTNFTAGDIIVLSSQNAGHDVTINDSVTGGGAIYLEGNVNFTLTGTKHVLVLLVINESGTDKCIELTRFNG